MEKLERIRLLLKIAIDVLQIIENELDNKIERNKHYERLEESSQTDYLGDRDYYDSFTRQK